MKPLFLTLALAFIAIPSWGQSPAWSRTNAEILCGNNLPDVRIKMCTSLIQLTGEGAPRLAAIYYNRGLAYWQKSLNDLALDDFTKAIYLNPQFAYAYVARGGVYSKKGVFDQAIADYTKAIELNLNDAHVYNNLAWAYHEKGEDAQGLTYAEKAVAIAPHYAYCIGTRGAIYEKLDQRDKAIADYRAALSLDPGDRLARDALDRLGVAP